MNRRIKIDYSTVLTLFPEAIKIHYLPRKKKKALKKKISEQIVSMLRETIKMDESRIFEQTALSEKFELEGEELEEFKSEMLKSRNSKRDMMDNAIGSKEKGERIKERIDNLLKK